MKKTQEKSWYIHKMYFQNYFPNRFKKLESFTICIYNICVHIVSDIQLSPSASVCIGWYNMAGHVVNSTSIYYGC